MGFLHSFNFVETSSETGASGLVMIFFKDLLSGFHALFQTGTVNTEKGREAGKIGGIILYVAKCIGFV